jgi:hypothetical protein
VVPQAVGAEVVDQLRQCDGAGAGLGDLLAALQQEAVHRDPAGRFEAGGEQGGRPVDGVEATDS